MNHRDIIGYMFGIPVITTTACRLGEILLKGRQVDNYALWSLKFDDQDLHIKFLDFLKEGILPIEFQVNSNQSNVKDFKQKYLGDKEKLVKFEEVTIATIIQSITDK